MVLGILSSNVKLVFVRKYIHLQLVIIANGNKASTDKVNILIYYMLYKMSRKKVDIGI